ncbi:MAG: hydroxyethylthiazole kinase [Firmicutes bacterium]|jgi:hydroxyethylthiazole kinase|nr:hydroxyethylthiazole kinase [Bacillota bacterium]
MERTINFFEKLRAKSPLVHNITNYVTVNDVANSILAVGGAPLMADDIEEVGEIVAISNALVINIGTLNRRVMRSMLEAGKIANELNIPVVLDPVGVGASSLRNEIVETLLEKVKFAVIKGNMSEIKALYTKSHNSGGVDVTDEDQITEENLESKVEFIKKVAKTVGSTIAVTGAIDIITDGKRVTLIKNGHENMSKITGTGCMTGGILGACCGAEGDYYKAAVQGVALMGMAGEYAAAKAVSVGSLRTHLIDGLDLVSKGIEKVEANYEPNDAYLGLYLVTDESWKKGEALFEDIEKSIEAGVTCVQYRKKSSIGDEEVNDAKKIKEIALKHDIPFIVNDHIALASEIKADGIHIGQGDTNLLKAREVVGKDMLIGVSVSNIEEAKLAEKNGADYLGVGAIFQTSSKDDANSVSIEMLKNIINSVEIPVVAIGGIGKNNIEELTNSKVSGVAVISAILGQESITDATRELKSLVNKYL